MPATKNPSIITFQLDALRLKFLSRIMRSTRTKSRSKLIRRGIDKLIVEHFPNAVLNS